MSKHHITHSCSHTATHNLVGNRSSREWRANKLAGEPCSVCWQAARDAARAAESAAAASASAAQGLPALDGSPKQIAWAESIRAAALAEKENIVSHWETIKENLVGKRLHEANGLRLDDYLARARAVYDARRAARGELETVASAKWWIDHRDALAFWVKDAFHVAYRREFADVIRRQEAEAAAVAAAQKAEADARAAARDAERTRQKTEREALRMETEVRAKSFRVGTRPGDVLCERGNITVRSQDGRVATGWVLDGDWAVAKIGDLETSSTHPEMERIAREARAIWESQP